ncbi:diguanylate cyclase/phosphodiesterase (GGDEF & EAL domains) with PAS/PAC sensor [Hydrogenimonas sp.]|nr:diguanylate cyclase/phosphodiesterase (GGDEF & EAL domains) with PAS/PAC sensor [Hydrogenimonas sp.]
MKHISRIYFFLISTIVLSVVYLHYGVSETHEKLIGNLEKIFVQQAGDFAKNIEDELLRHTGPDKNLYDFLKTEKELRKELEHTLSALITPSFKYIYVLYRDKKGKYRYLLDGSREDKGRFNQKLDVDKQKWNRCYSERKDQVLMQKNLEGLWITYLRPIVKNDSVDGVIAIDFSTNLPSTIASATRPLENIFLYIFVAIGILLLILVYQTILNIKTKKESIIDPLTSTYNRNFLRTFLKSINPAKYQIMMVDIDHFKKINDTFGHKAGDLVLREVATVIKNELREKDRVIRFGGEEFLIFLYKEKSECLAAKKISKRLKESIEKRTFTYEDTPIHITVSIGITSNPEHFKSVPDAIKRADEMLYIAKREGRNRIIFDNPDHEGPTSEKKTISEVKEALEEGRITCHYQPIVDLKSGKIIKYEALVRMVEKDGKILTPYLFLDSIAYTNIYTDLTKRVLTIVLEQIKLQRMPISINLNISDILDNMVYMIIAEEIEENLDLAQWLVIELLENEPIHNVENLRERLTKLKSYGVKIAIDDFGSGFSNFSIFQELPIDILKIDGSLVKDLDTSKIAFTITESITLFAKKLQIECVAEFIHSEEILQIVKDLGIENGQGFHLGRPEDRIAATAQASETSA